MPIPRQPQLQFPFDLLLHIRLDHIPHVDVVETLDADAALEPGGHLLRIILEPPQGGDPPVIDDNAVPKQPETRASG